MASTKKVVAEWVTEALLLDGEIAERSARLEKLKEKLRAEAGKLSDGEKVVFEGEGGSAEVVFVSDKLVLRKGANPRALLGKLPEETWKHLFEERTTVSLTPAFEAALPLTAKAERALVEPLIESKSSSPRVSLKANR